MPNLSDLFFVTYGVGVRQRPTSPRLGFMDKFQAKFKDRPVTSHAITGYSVIEGWSRAVEKAGTFEADKVREALETFNDEPLLAGPTTYTKDFHINMQRDLILLEVKDGKPGNMVGVVKAAEYAGIHLQSGVISILGRAECAVSVGNCAGLCRPSPGGQPTSSSTSRVCGRSTMSACRAAGRDPWPDRPEWRRKDDADQRAYWLSRGEAARFAMEG